MEITCPAANRKMMVQEAANLVERDGFAIVPQLLPEEVTAALRAAAEHLLSGTENTSLARRGDGSTFGTRNVFDVLPEARMVVPLPAVRALVEAILGPSCFAVRALLFDKTPQANWVVPWHQDLSIAVKTRQEIKGWGPWSEKAGVPHVQPPPALLARMLAVRLHLDDCGAENGPLRVLPGTHQQGRLNTEAIRHARETQSETVCTVPKGGAILMRPLLLHASSPAALPGHRRVLHLEWAGKELPGLLEWYEIVR